MESPKLRPSKLVGLGWQVNSDLVQTSLVWNGNRLAQSNNNFQNNKKGKMNWEKKIFQEEFNIGLQKDEDYSKM